MFQVKASPIFPRPIKPITLSLWLIVAGAAFDMALPKDGCCGNFSFLRTELSQPSKHQDKMMSNRVAFFLFVLEIRNSNHWINRTPDACCGVTW